jgi:hypothetical protein
LDKLVIPALTATLDQLAHKVLWDKMGIMVSAVPKATRVRQAPQANKVQRVNAVQLGL